MLQIYQNTHVVSNLIAEINSKRTKEVTKRMLNSNNILQCSNDKFLPAQSEYCMLKNSAVDIASSMQKEEFPY